MLTCRAVSSLGTIFISGSTDGIGLTTAKNMAAKGYDVILHGRDAQRIQRAREKVQAFVRDHSNEEPRVFTLPPTDLSTIRGSFQLASHVEDLCQKEDIQLTVLLNNAGVYAEEHTVTSDGEELTFAVNVVAPFVLTSMLLSRMAPQSRVVIASSISQCANVRDWDDLAYETRRYSAHAAYSESKLLDAMLTMEFASRLEGRGVTCNCLDPGTVNTKMLLAGWGPCGMDVEDALDETWLCSSDEVKDLSGRYFVYKSDRRASSTAYEAKERARLWLILSKLAPEAAAKWESIQ